MLISQQQSRRQTSVRQKAYWHKKLSRILPEYEWPCDATDGAHHGSKLAFDSCEEKIELPARVTAQLNQLIVRENSTLLATLLATFQAMLLRYTGQEDLVIGSISTDSYREIEAGYPCLLYTSPSPRDLSTSRMPSSA